MTDSDSEKEHDLMRQAVNEVVGIEQKYGQMGTLIDVTPVEDLTKHYTVRKPPDKAWVVRFHVVFPHDRKDIFLVAQRSGKIAIEYTLGYDPIESGQ